MTRPVGVGDWISYLGYKGHVYIGEVMHVISHERFNVRAGGAYFALDASDILESRSKEEK
jgi:hypothetical protein